MAETQTSLDKRLDRFSLLYDIFRNHENYFHFSITPILYIMKFVLQVAMKFMCKKADAINSKG